MARRSQENLSSGALRRSFAAVESFAYDLFSHRAGAAAAERLCSREQTGMSAPEVVDCIRAEEMRGKMKAQLRGFVTGFFSRKDAEPQRTATEIHHARTQRAQRKCGGTEDLADEIWAALKESRKGPRWHRTTWAAGFGFSSYSKFFRACFLCYGKTPHQIEIELIDEILLEAGRRRRYERRTRRARRRPERTRRGAERKAETVKRE